MILKVSENAYLTEIWSIVLLNTTILIKIIICLVILHKFENMMKFQIHV